MRKLYLLLSFFLAFSTSYSQGLGIPSRKGGIGFGNLPRFVGVRLNAVDKDVEKIVGVNVTAWQSKDESLQTGSMTGLSIGLPMAFGEEKVSGIGVGILGVGAKKDLSWINVGGLGMGAGGNIKGISVGGLGMGAGGNITGINVGGLGAGAGGNVSGISFGGLGVGGGGNLSGFSFGGLGAGAGKGVYGVAIGGLGVGAGENVNGLAIGGLGVGAGESVNGIAAAVVGVGAGKEVKGLMVAGVGVGAPKVRAITVSLCAGGMDIKGLFITPAYLTVGSKHADEDAVMGGLSVSAFNHIKGTQRGVTVGVFNYAYKQRGLQIGVLNYIKENPKGLRLLPLFNVRMGKRGE